MNKKDIDYRRKHSVGDTVIYLKKYKNFIDSVDKDFIHSIVEEEIKRKNPNIHKVLIPYLVKGKPTITYGGVAKIIEIDTFDKMTSYTLDAHNNLGDNIVVWNPNILKVLSVDNDTY